MEHKLVNLLWHLLNRKLLQSHWMGSTWCPEHSLCAHIFWDSVGQACLSGRKHKCHQTYGKPWDSKIFPQENGARSFCLLLSKCTGCSLAIENEILLYLLLCNTSLEDGNTNERNETSVPDFPHTHFYQEICTCAAAEVDEDRRHCLVQMPEWNLERKHTENIWIFNLKKKIFQGINEKKNRK